MNNSIVYLPKGMRAGGVNCGVRINRPDLGLIVSDLPATAAGVYTQNTAKAACVLYCQKITPASDVRAIVVNSGQANAATGILGEKNNLLMAQACAQVLGVRSKQVLTLSTGLIGVHLAVERINEALPLLVQNNLSNQVDTFSEAIITTDLVTKKISRQVVLSGGTVTVTGVAKGSGMIHPNMATMLGHLLCDVALSPQQGQAMLQQAVDRSFNMISVDGEMSTNDTVLLLANGASGVACPVNSPDEQRLQQAFNEVCTYLAKAIVRDGEGASKLIEVKVSGAPSLAIAIKAARGLTVGPLFKSAMHGEDPNWGRIYARLGAEGVPVELMNLMDIEVQGSKVFQHGAPIPFDYLSVRNALHTSEQFVAINFNCGNHQAIAWGCDLTKKYVAINAEYST